MPYIIIGALIIGLLLGLMGSGGSILTVPVLVYLLGHDAKVAIAESLAIVGGIAIVTMFPYAHSRSVCWRNVVFFGVPGMAGTYLGAWLSHYLAGAVQLTLFAVMMLLAAVLMFRTKVADGNRLCIDWYRRQSRRPRGRDSDESNRASQSVCSLSSRNGPVRARQRGTETVDGDSKQSLNAPGGSR